MLSENEPFSISRESFDSYRRSFVREPPRKSRRLAKPTGQDISARSPVGPDGSTTPRQSLDARVKSPARSALRPSSQLERPEEERFEDVGLNDESKVPPKKKSIFARFGDNSEGPTNSDNSRPSSSHRGFHLPGRKRGHSGQGAELGHIDRPPTKGEDDGVIR